MFDSLQEGIIVCSLGEIDFMNELSNKVLSAIAGLKNFKYNKAIENSMAP